MKRFWKPPLPSFFENFKAPRVTARDKVNLTRIRVFIHRDSQFKVYKVTIGRLPIFADSWMREPTLETATVRVLCLWQREFDRSALWSSGFPPRSGESGRRTETPTAMLLCSGRGRRREIWSPWRAERERERYRLKCWKMELFRGVRNRVFRVPYLLVLSD